jgi:hypothetical protein
MSSYRQMTRHCASLTELALVLLQILLTVIMLLVVLIIVVVNRGTLHVGLRAAP